MKTICMCMMMVLVVSCTSNTCGQSSYQTVKIEDLEHEIIKEKLGGAPCMVRSKIFCEGKSATFADLHKAEADSMLIHTTGVIRTTLPDTEQVWINLYTGDTRITHAELVDKDIATELKALNQPITAELVREYKCAKLRRLFAEARGVSAKATSSTLSTVSTAGANIVPSSNIYANYPEVQTLMDQLHLQMMNSFEQAEKNGYAKAIREENARKRELQKLVDDLIEAVILNVEKRERARQAVND